MTINSPCTLSQVVIWQVCFLLHHPWEWPDSAPQTLYTRGIIPVYKLGDSVSSILVTPLKTLLPYFLAVPNNRWAICYCFCFNRVWGHGGAIRHDPVPFLYLGCNNGFLPPFMDGLQASGLSYRFIRSDSNHYMASNRPTPDSELWEVVMVV